MSAEVFALVTRVVSIHEFERAGIVAESAEGERCAGGVVLLRNRMGGVGLPAHFVVNAGLFHTPDPHAPPAGDGHVFDEGLLEGGLGLEFFEQSVDEEEKAIRGLAF
jgi:hypothetical protein